jgi:hypothetical protein
MMLLLTGRKIKTTHPLNEADLQQSHLMQRRKDHLPVWLFKPQEWQEVHAIWPNRL